MSDTELFRNPLALRTDTSEEGSPGVGALLDKGLTKKTHADDTLHYVGEALPAATDAETAPVHIANLAGNSPFPARADHQHLFKVPVCVGYIPGATQVVGPNSSAFINQWSVISPTNWLTTGNQVWQVPYTGRYLTTANIYIDNVSGSGTGVTHWYAFQAHINDGAASYILELSSYPVVGGFGGSWFYRFTFAFSQHFQANGYFQFSHANFQTNSVYVGSSNITIMYLGPDS